MVGVIVVADDTHIAVVTELDIRLVGSKRVYSVVGSRTWFIASVFVPEC